MIVIPHNIDIIEVVYLLVCWHISRCVVNIINM